VRWRAASPYAWSSRAGRERRPDLAAMSVFVDVPAAGEILHHEFGPVLALQPFEDDEHAIAWANDSRHSFDFYCDVRTIVERTALYAQDGGA